MNDTKIDPETSMLDTCAQHGREILASQLLLIKDKGYDFAPQFRQMTIQLYLVGAMWRHGEELGLTMDARDHAFVALHSILIGDGMKKKGADQRIAFLRSMSRLEDGVDTLAIAAGYQAAPGDADLTTVFDEYLNEVRVSGALWRLYDRGKKIMFIGGGAAAFVAIWSVTLFLPDSSGVAILTAGVVAAALVVIPTFLIGILIYRKKIKKIHPPTSP
ncbi:MAG: hypothetical protein D4R40_02145 [Nitrosomonadaceae bacterium]|nr:MAG: hypothetical protein D4R40_02145 [Nitrosomonadaceae bacterium]